MQSNDDANMMQKIMGFSGFGELLIMFSQMTMRFPFAAFKRFREFR